jgi:hypothetical protein
MTKYPLEWGWDQPDISKSSTSSEWNPPATLPGSHDGDVTIAAVGDLRCEGVCSEGGTWGTTAAYSIGNKNLCRDWAVKKIGVEKESGAEQNKALRPFEIRGR